jgi:beta-phosphoglucomutase
MKWSAAIFDMDGVVVDTVPIHFQAWKRMAEDYGRSFTFEDYKAKVDGIPRIDGTRAILQGMDEATVLKAGERKQAYFLELLGQGEIPTYDTTLKLIAELQERGIRVAVISASKNAPAILERIGLLEKLDAVVSGLEITHGKPDPQVFLVAAQKLGADPAACVVFEDAVLGVEAAGRAKMACVGIDRYASPDRLAKADLVIADAGEITPERLEELVTQHANLAS